MERLSRWGADAWSLAGSHVFAQTYAHKHEPARNCVSTPQPTSAVISFPVSSEKTWSDSEHEEELETRDIAIGTKVTIISSDHAYWHTYSSIASVLWPSFRYCSVNTGNQHGMAPVARQVLFSSNCSVQSTWYNGIVQEQWWRVVPASLHHVMLPTLKDFRPRKRNQI